MSLRGYKKKAKAALWVEIFPRQKSTRNGTGRHSAKELREYAMEAKAHVAMLASMGVECPVVRAIAELNKGMKYGHPISARLSEVHHTRGRNGPLLLDKRHWLVVSKQGHRWIHMFPSEARRMGWLCEPGLWNVPDRS